MTTRTDIRVAKRIHRVASECVYKSDVQVFVHPLGERFEIQFKKQEGNFIEEERDMIRAFLLGPFKEEVKEHLLKIGWKEYRVNACPRQLLNGKYTWNLSRR